MTEVERRDARGRLVNHSVIVVLLCGLVVSSYDDVRDLIQPPSTTELVWRTLSGTRRCPECGDVEAALALADVTCEELEAVWDRLGFVAEALTKTVDAMAERYDLQRLRDLSQRLAEARSQIEARDKVRWEQNASPRE